MIILIFLIFLFFPSISESYDNSLPHMHYISGLEKYAGELLIGHNFLGEVGEGETETGIGKGANVTLGTGFIPFPNLETAVYYRFRHSEIWMDLGYSHNFKYLSLKAGAGYFTYKEIGLEDRRNNFVFFAVAESPELFGRINLTLNGSYDNYNRQPGMGVAASFRIVDGFYLVGEFIPLLRENGENRNVKEKHIYSASLRIVTWGHHFHIFITNTVENDFRRTTLGAESYSPHIGFRIKRRFDLFRNWGDQ